LEQWIKMNLEDIEEKLSSCGAILFRGFDVQSASDFRVAMSAFGKEIMDYTERTSPGTHVAELSAENIALINKGIDNHLKND
jgi:hypothetical protein